MPGAEQTVDLVFTDPPGPDSQFVEVEDEHGRGLKVGEWRQREDGYWCLRLTVATTPKQGREGDTE